MRNRVWVGVPFVLLWIALTTWIFWPEPRIEHVGPSVDPVAQTVEVEVETVRRRLRTGLEQAFVRSPIPMVSAVTFGDERNEVSPDQLKLAGHLENNPGLSRYAKRPPVDRAGDVWVTTLGRVWGSEYVRGSEPAPFSTDFLIQIDPIDETSTRIEVIEYAPHVLGGWRGTLCGPHLVPGVWRERIPVAPTTQDRQQVLDLVLRVSGH